MPQFAFSDEFTTFFKVVLLMSATIAGRFVMALILIVTGAASAQYYPNKPIRIVTSKAGAATEISACLVAQGCRVHLASEQSWTPSL